MAVPTINAALGVLTDPQLVRLIGSYRRDVHGYIRDAWPLRGPSGTVAGVAIRRGHAAALAEIWRLAGGDINNGGEGPREGHGLIDARAADAAAERNQLELLAWLHARGYRQFDPDRLVLAVARNHVAVALWLVRHATWDVRHGAQATSMAAAKGQIEVLEAIDALGHDGWFTPSVMDHAAATGQLKVLEWLHVRRPEGCTSVAMDSAATLDRLEILEWLHAHRSEGCTSAAMDHAASQGNLLTMKWLHAHRTEGCTPAAMSSAIRLGRLDIIKWLYRHYPDSWHHNGDSGFTHTALRHGNTRALEWLLTNVRPCGDDYTVQGIADAIRYYCSNLHVVEALALLSRQRPNDPNIDEGLRRAFLDECRSTQSQDHGGLHGLVTAFRVRLDMVEGLNAILDVVAIDGATNVQELLPVAVRNDNSKLVYLIGASGLVSGADLVSALRMAIVAGHMRSIQALIDVGVDKSDPELIDLVVRHFTRAKAIQIFPHHAREIKQKTARIARQKETRVFLERVDHQTSDGDLLHANLPPSLATAFLRHLLERRRQDAKSRPFLSTLAENAPVQLPLLTSTEWIEVTAISDPAIDQFVDRHRAVVVHHKAMQHAAQRGHLHALQYLHARGVSVPSAAIDAAWSRGHQDVARWLTGLGLAPSAHARQLSTERGHNVPH